MSTSLLYHGFGIRGYDYWATRYQEGEIFLTIEAPRESLKCPACGSAHVHIDEWCPRRWRTLPIGSKTVWIEMDVPKVECQDCRAKRRVNLVPGPPKRQHTKKFERYAMELLQFMTPQDASAHLGISWDVANDIQKRRLGKRFARPKLKRLKHIAIDEIYLGQETQIHHAGARSGFRRGGVRGQWQRPRRLKTLLEKAQIVRSQDQSRGHGHVSGVHFGGAESCRTHAWCSTASM